MADQELCLQWDVDPIDPSLDTLPKNFVATARKFSTEIAIRKKRYGIWQEITWEESFQHVHDFCLGLIALGLKRGDKVLIIGDNDPEFYWGELAAHAAGATTIGVFADAIPRELEYLIANSDTVLVIAQDQEQCDKLLELRERTPQILKVVFWDERGLWSYQDDWLTSFQAVEALGQEYARQKPGAFEKSVAEGRGDDVAILSYTSGTTSLPKGAMITHLNMLFASTRHVTPEQRLFPQEDYVSFSPMAWITEQTLGLTYHVAVGTTVNFPEKAETVQSDIREIAPVSFLAPSRLWESTVGQVQARMADANWINRLIYYRFLQVGYKIADLADNRQDPNLLWRILYYVGHVALFAPLREKLGLNKLRFAYTSGAALSPDVLRFFRALNIELLQLYGSTECMVHTHHYLGDVRLGTVGQPAPGVKIKVTGEGEIAIQSRSVCSGYYKSPEKTEEAFMDGWYYTGDAGYIDENEHLVFLDRLSDMIELAGGEKFSPQYIEGRLKFSPYIQDVMAIGGSDMTFVSALVTLRFDNVARWAEKRGIAFTTLSDLSQRSEVYQLITQEVERVNKLLPPASRIHRFVILNKTFDADEAEVTRTRKLRRRHLEQAYQNLLNGIYEGAESAKLQSEVVYQDGRTRTSEVNLRIQSVEHVV